MMRLTCIPLVALGLAACAPAVPESGGVGFQDYGSYIREAEPVPPAPAPTVLPPTGAIIGAPTVGAGFDPTAAAAAIDRADGIAPAQPLSPSPLSGAGPLAPVTQGAAPFDGSLDPNRPRGDAPLGIAVESGEMTGNSPAISDEQDFAAVSARETIESDKARIERNRAQYVVVQPGALPTRSGESGPNIVEYALATTHAPGVQLHPRRSLIQRDPAVACAKFASPDLAQQDFLARGGPDRDRLGLDPDGDGYACSWDPRPFRNALK